MNMKTFQQLIIEYYHSFIEATPDDEECPDQRHLEIYCNYPNIPLRRMIQEEKKKYET